MSKQASAPGKQQLWRQTMREAKKVTDKLGMPIDKDILETVVVLNLLGFNTTASCGGHLRRNTGGPFVIIQSQPSQQYADKARQIGESDPSYRKLSQKANYYRAQDLQRLTELLDHYYRLHRPYRYHHHIIVQSMPMTMNILECQGADAAFMLKGQDKKDLLRENQAEMTAFTEYLKTIYFDDHK